MKNKKKWFLIGGSIALLSTISLIAIPITISTINYKKNNHNNISKLNVKQSEIIITSNSNNFNFEIIKPFYNIELNMEFIQENNYRLSLMLNELIISIDNESNQTIIEPNDIKLSLIFNYQIDNKFINTLNIIFNLNNKKIDIQNKTNLKFTNFHLSFDVEIIKDSINKISNQNINFELT